MNKVVQGSGGVLCRSSGQGLPSYAAWDPLAGGGLGWGGFGEQDRA